jgi:hypothetical protein
MVRKGFKLRAWLTRQIYPTSRKEREMWGHPLFGSASSQHELVHLELSSQAKSTAITS